MKKIGLITYHSAYNYGAALQAFAAQAAINGMGQACTIINYQPSARKNSYDMGYQIRETFKKGNPKLALKMFFGNFFMQKRKRAFDKFNEEYVQWTEQEFQNETELKQIENQYDLFVAGSDQIWKSGDPVYLLSFVRDKQKAVSYSSSFGMTVIPDENRSVYYDNLVNMKCLSSREDTGVKIIKELTGRDAALVLDPVFLLSKEQWEKIMVRSKKKPGKLNLFVYTSEAGMFKKFLDKVKWKPEKYHAALISRHINPKDFISSNTTVAYSISPAEFLGFVAESDLIVTASFHCAAFCIILQKQFVVLLKEDDGLNSRLTNLLKLVNLEDRILTESSTRDEILAPIDFTDVQKRLDEHIFESKKYLEGCFLD